MEPILKQLQKVLEVQFLVTWQISKLQLCFQRYSNILKLGKHLSIVGEYICWICYSRIAVLIVGLQWDLDMWSMELVSRDLSFKSITHSSCILWSDYVSNWTMLKNVTRQPWKMRQVGQPWKNVFNQYYYNNHLMFVKNFDVAIPKRIPNINTQKNLLQSRLTFVIEVLCRSMLPRVKFGSRGVQGFWERHLQV